MRYGFFCGVEGEQELLSAALLTLADCDRIVSLGNLVGGSSVGDLGCWEAFRALGERGILVGGEGERRFAKARGLPPSLRQQLRALAPSRLEEGVAFLGEEPREPARSRREAHALGGAPRLIAPLAIAADSRGSKLWRERGGMVRVVEFTEGERISIGSGRLRLEIGTLKSARAHCAVIDLEARALEFRLLLAGGRTSPPIRRAPRRSVRRRAVDERQCLLAV